LRDPLVRATVPVATFIPPPSEWQAMADVTFRVDGEAVAGTLCEPADDGTPVKGALVLMHGLLSQRSEFSDAPERFASRGWRALAIDARGFGASSGKRGRIHQARMVADVLGAVRYLRDLAPDLPIGLVGHSMGASAVLGAMVEDKAIAAAVLGAPMWTIRAELGEGEFFAYRAGNAASRLKAKLGLGGLVIPYRVDYADLFDDPDAVARARKTRFLSANVNLDNYDDLMGLDCEPLARQVERPVAVILGRNDKVVRPSSSRRVHMALAGEKTLVELDCGHSLFGDHRADEAVAHADAWFSRHLLK